MEVKVKLSNLRISPRKSRMVIDLIRGKNVAEARALLEFTVKKAANPVLKLLNSAVASAVNDLKLKESDLYISKITSNDGPTLKRSHPMSRGRAYQIMKRTSHINLVLSERENNKVKNQKNINKKLKIKKRIKSAS